MVEVRTLRRIAVLAVLVAAAGTAAGRAATDPKPPAEPAAIKVRVSPAPTAPGSVASVRVELEPKAGIKINRYPKIRLQVEASPGLVAAAEGTVGSDSPPPPDKTNANYFDRVDPLVLDLRLDPGATAGSHRLEGRLTYYYCVTESGFCAPSRSKIEIPIDVR
jgi:hypothetical protein